MPFSRLSGFLAIVLFVAYFGPVAVKLKEWPLTVVILGGLALAAIDLWESLKD